MTANGWKVLPFFQKIEDPHFGPDLSALNLDEITYYNRATEESGFWDQVPDKIKDTFEKLGIPKRNRVI